MLFSFIFNIQIKNKLMLTNFLKKKMTTYDMIAATIKPKEIIFK